MQKSVQTVKSQNFLLYLHNFRAISILFIIGIHVYASLIWERNEFGSHQFLRVLFDESTLLFVFISGFLFHHLIDRYETHKYLKKKFKVVFQPYIFFSIPVILIRIYIDKHSTFLIEQIPDFITWPDYIKFAYYLITGSHLRPLWFIPMLALFYFVAPLLFWLNKQESIYRYLPVFILISFLIGRGSHIEIVRNFLHFLPIYILGMYVSLKKKLVFFYLNKWYKLILLFGFSIFLISLIFPSNQSFFIQKISLIFVMLFLLKKYTEKINSRVQKLLDLLATYSFGLYFIHDYFDVTYKYILSKTIERPFLHGNLLLWLVIFCSTVFLSILTLKALKLMFGNKSREVIGC